MLSFLRCNSLFSLPSRRSFIHHKPYRFHYSNESSPREYIRTSLPIPDSMVKEIDINNSTLVTIKYHNLIRALSIFVGEQSNKSYSILPYVSFQSEDFEESHSYKEANLTSKRKARTQLGMGLGWHTINFEDRQLKILYEVIGYPFSENGFYENIVIVAEGPDQHAIIHRFCEHVLDWEENHKEKFIVIFKYNTYNTWTVSDVKPIRTLSSVLLLSTSKTAMIQDFDEFISVETYSWYKKHGIPYKRCYLFYGPPGSGKTSMIQAIASHYKRKLCFLQPISSGFTDDNFSLALQKVPPESLVVMEDIDTFFGKDRQPQSSKCLLTFSGLLNGLDGISSTEGQIIILTTNFLNKLDDALIRSGRVDKKIEFPSLTTELAYEMFIHFYPGEETAATIFKEAMNKKLETQGTKRLSMADLQQYFIKHRKHTAEVASTDLDALEVEPLLQQKSNFIF